MFQTSSGISKLIVLINDCICLAVALLLSAYIRNGRSLGNDIDTYGFSFLLIVSLCVYLVISLFKRFHVGFYMRGWFAEILHDIKINLVLVISVVLVLYFVKQGDYSRWVLILFPIFNCIFMVATHQILKKLLPYFYKKLIRPVNTLVIGTKDFVTDILSDKITSKDYSSNPIGVILTDSIVEENAHAVEDTKVLDVPVVCKVEEIGEYCKTAMVDEVIVTADKNTKPVLLPVLDELASAGIVIRYHIGMPDFHGAPFQMINKIGDYYVANYANKMASAAELAIKRLFDIVAGFFGVIVMAIILIFFGPAIKLESEGPIFFKQSRVGKNGRIFKIYKFRSMYIDAEERKKELMARNEMDGLMFKMEDDPRITKVGKFMRKTSLDEFPQFINVLMGDMSMVGTRPPTLDEFSQYNLNQKSRLSFRPGLTGLWQVSGRNSIKDFNDIVKLDVDYIKNWSISEDIRILLKTIPAMLSGK